MKKKTMVKDFITYDKGDVMHVAQALIAVSSIIAAVSDQYAGTGQVSVGALLHASNVVDEVIERLDLVGILEGYSPIPF